MILIFHLSIYLSIYYIIKQCLQRICVTSRTILFSVKTHHFFCCILLLLSAFFYYYICHFVIFII